MATRRRRGGARRAAAGYSSPACSLHELAPVEGGGAAGVQVKRIYEPADARDGFRALVDRLWPRGISKERAALDEWLRDLAPSTALRKWFHQDPARWAEFTRRYRAELRAQQTALAALRQRARRQRVTLLYGARDPRHNHARLLRELLLKS